jgi:hypothetical protein
MAEYKQLGGWSLGLIGNASGRKLVCVEEPIRGLEVFQQIGAATVRKGEGQ